MKEPLRVISKKRDAQPAGSDALQARYRFLRLTSRHYISWFHASMNTESSKR
jgi:hypothetical protein